MTSIKKYTDEIISIIWEHLPSCRIIFFGSRVNGNNRRFSDVDVAIDDGALINWSALYDIKEQLSLTDIPYIVDLSDYHSVSNSFRGVIDDTGETINQSVDSLSD